MLGELFVGTLFLGTYGKALFPEEAKIIKQAAQLPKEQMAASAKSTNCPLIKGYRTQDDARRHRTGLSAGETIYFPNGMQITVEPGLKDVQCDGWWYAWGADEPPKNQLPFNQ